MLRKLRLGIFSPQLQCGAVAVAKFQKKVSNLRKFSPKDIAALNAPCVEETSGDYPTICNIFQSKDIRLIVAGYQVDDISRVAICR